MPSEQDCNHFEQPSSSFITIFKKRVPVHNCVRRRGHWPGWYMACLACYQTRNACIAVREAWPPAEGGFKRRFVTEMQQTGFRRVTSELPAMHINSAIKCRALWHNSTFPIECNFCRLSTFWDQVIPRQEVEWLRQAVERILDLAVDERVCTTSAVVRPRREKE